MSLDLLDLVQMGIFIILTILYYGIGPHFTHIVIKRILSITYITLILVTAIAFRNIRYNIEITEKPIQTTKAKVISKEDRRGQHGPRSDYSGYYAFFLSDNGNKLELAISKEQFKAINENDSVELTYQGRIVYCIKNLTDGTVIIDKGWAPKDMEFK